MSWAHRTIYHAIQSYRGEPVRRILKEIQKSQWWPEEKLRDYQLMRLKEVLAAARQVPLYQRAWAAAGVASEDLKSLSDLPQFPTVDKDLLRREPEALRNPEHRGPFNVHVTTGSSGVPLKVYRSRLASAHGRAAQARGRSWFGLRLADREIVFGGIALEREGHLRARAIDYVMNRIRLSPFDLSDERLAQYLAIIRRERPRYLYGYPSTLSTFAAFVERIGRGGEIKIDLVQCASEKLYEHRREIIQKAFNCPVIDEYGAAEVSIVGMECPAGSLHQASENVHLEIVDERLRPVPVGVDGEVIVTDLNNLGAPLVRYRLGDRARFLKGPCSCGRRLPRLEVLAGSSFGVVKLPDGRTLGGIIFDALAGSMLTRSDAGLSEIVLYRRGNKITARAVPRAGGNLQRDRAELRERLAEILGPGIELEVVLVDRIERRGGDKYQVLIDETS